MNNEFKAETSTGNSTGKFMLPCISITRFTHVMQLWPISALNRKHVHGYLLDIQYVSFIAYLRYTYIRYKIT